MLYNLSKYNVAGFVLYCYGVVPPVLISVNWAGGYKYICFISAIGIIFVIQRYLTKAVNQSPRGFRKMVLLG
ncbi:hypothetical protein S225a_23000 [Candidatus Brocadiaceae bacterium S225]|nr:hypothetical protein S225a_23000 [Candidatus Brocadiaceae bacterium S225]